MKDSKNRRYDTVIFDLDGTLLDTLTDLTNSTNAIMEQYGMPVYQEEQIRAFVGNGIRRLLEQAVTREVSEGEFEQIQQDFRKYYDQHCMDDTEPYPGILLLLDWLKKEGYQTAVVSNKADFAVKKLCDVYFKGLLGTAVGESPSCPKKPAPDSVFEAMRVLRNKQQRRDVPECKVSDDMMDISQEQKARTVYVGDSEVDILTARNAGLDCIAVSWGFRSREVLLECGAQEDHIADNVNELKNLLLAE